MNRKSERYTGVFQRCASTCGPKECSKHKWSYTIELPAGPNGKRRQITKSGFDTAKKAHIARQEIAGLDRSGKLANDTKTTFGAWLGEWLDGKVKRGELAQTTYRTYKAHIDSYIVPKLGRFKMLDLRGSIISRAYIQIMEDTANRSRPVNAETVRRIHAIVSGSLKAAVEDDRIPTNPAANAKLPKVTKVKVVPPTPEQYADLLDAAAGHRMFSLFHLAGHSGLRRGELAGLRWSDIDWARGRLTVRWTRTSSGYKIVEKPAKSEAGQDRVVPLDSGTVAELKAWKAQQAKERLQWGEAWHDMGLVFTQEDGTGYHPDKMTDQFTLLAQRAGLPTDLHLHSLRHYFASALISSGCGIAVVSKMMGHASIKVTSDVYGHLFDEASANATELAAALLHQARTRTA